MDYSELVARLRAALALVPDDGYRSVSASWQAERDDDNRVTTITVSVSPSDDDDDK